MRDEWARAVVQVGDGRGFVVEAGHRRLIITAGHCLPNLPPSHPGSYDEERTYTALLGPLGAEPAVWTECLFVDPVADLAVLGSPDNQELADEAEAYEALVEGAVALPLGRLTFARKQLALPDGTVFPGPPSAQSEAQLLSLSGHWFSCRVKSRGRSLWIEGATESIQGGMSGSPIIAPDGAALGVVCVSRGGCNLSDHREGGPNPLLYANLPAWMIMPPGE
jgi:hypothetical protein